MCGVAIAVHAWMEANPLNDLSYLIIQAAIQVHRTLGPGLLEGVYRACFMHELRKRRLAFVSEHPVPIYYDGVLVDEAYRLDLLIEDQVVVELKATGKVLPVHGAQLLSYLRLSGKPLGLLINFNVPLLTDGVIRRITAVQRITKQFDASILRRRRTVSWRRSRSDRRNRRVLCILCVTLRLCASAFGRKIRRTNLLTGLCGSARRLPSVDVCACMRGSDPGRRRRRCRP